MINYSSLDVFNKLSSLMVYKSDQVETIYSVLDLIKTIAESDKIFCVEFGSEGENNDSVFFAKNSPFSGAVNPELLDCLKHIAQTNKTSLLGARFTETITANGLDAYDFNYPVFMPLIFEEKVIGAAFCDFSGSREDFPEKEEMFLILCRFLTVVFTNYSYVNRHSKHEKTLLSILDNIDANIYVSDMNADDLLFVNKKMMAEFNIDKKSIGKKCWQVFQTGMSDRCSFCPSYDLVKDPSKEIVWEEHNTVTEKYYRNTDTVIKWIDGRNVHLQHSIDITNEKYALNNEKDLKRQAELASKAKSDFLSRMSHEIRTPINAIIGMAKIGLSAKEPEKTLECLKKIDSSSEQLLAIINDILDMSKIEANKMELVSESFDFEKVLIDISNIISVRSEEKQQKLHIHIDMSMPRFYIGDSVRLTQVITNLLSNAVKFTPDHGVVRMNISEKKRTGNTSTIEVSVTDTGIGVPADQQKTLFNSFEQADGSISRRFGGTGLGLAISKRIVEMMNGEIWVKSELGEGSTFTFTADLKHVEDCEAWDRSRNYTDIDISTLRVLFFDTSLETRQYFERIMSKFNVSCTTCATEEECVALLNEMQSGVNRFDIVFLDWNNAGNTPELCSLIKKEYGSTIIILISEKEWDEIQPEIERDGIISKHISKPIFPSILYDSIQDVIRPPVARMAQARAKNYNFSNFRLLLAEDVEVNREIIISALEDTKIKIDHAENGQAAFNMFKENPLEYDIILMDVNMPLMDGYEATRLIRQLPEKWAKQVPILAMTANAFAEDIAASLESGMNDHLSKPIEFDLLLSRLSTYLSAKDGKKCESESSAYDKFSAPDLARYVNVEEALNRLRGNKKIYKTLLNSFVKDNKINQLVAVTKAMDSEAAANTAYSIKGVAANLSLTALLEVITDFEQKARIGTLDKNLLLQCVDTMRLTIEKIELLLQVM